MKLLHGGAPYLYFQAMWNERYINRDVLSLFAVPENEDSVCPTPRSPTMGDAQLYHKAALRDAERIASIFEKFGEQHLFIHFFFVNKYSILLCI